MKVRYVIDALKDMNPDDELAIQWYTKDDVELNLQKKIAPESWEFVCDYACEEPSMSDFSIPYLLEKAEDNENLEKSNV
jgi:hypothetical protein